MKKIFILVIIGLFSISTVSPPVALDELPIRKAGDKPNFILIVADDLGFGDLGFNGSTQIKTPSIDKLAESGAIFTQGYVTSAVCSPSRAGFLTGRNQVAFGHDNNLGGNQPGFDPQYLGLPLSEKTIADYLKPLGYINGLVGKWHLGYESQFHPLKRGFDEFWGYRGGGHDYFSDDKNLIECNYRQVEPITYITDDVGSECVGFIERHRKEPFFLFASFNAPHTPMQATEEDLELYSHIQNKKRRTYAAMVHRLDVNVGRIVDAVDQARLKDNTLIVFISDNGGPYDTNGSINAPYRGQKGSLLEGGIHVPFVMNWPQSIPSGKIMHDPVVSLDFAPTFVALAGGQIFENAKFDGVNLMPFIRGQNTKAPHSELMWRFTISASIRNGDWKLVRLPDRLPLLYHLPSDTAEQNNLALRNLEKTEELLKKLGDWDVNLPHPVFLEGAIWKKRQLALYDKNYQLVQPELARK